MRFTVLTPEMIRIEWSDTKQFEDRASFTVVNRDLPVPSYTTEKKDGFLYIKTEKIELRYKENSYPITTPASSKNLKITFELNGTSTTWYPGKPDPFNLKGTLRTLDHSSGDNLRGDMEDGLLSRSGWALIDEYKPNGDNSKSLLFEDQGGAFDWVAPRNPDNKIDWYFMAYGHDYKKALRDYTKVGGKQPMPPLYSLGYWYSKYEEYSEQDFKNLVNVMQEKDIPIDVMVIDMDWHKEGWTGWSWNRDLFPDPQGFIEWLHENNLKTTLNLHPADGIGTHEDNYEALANELNHPTNETIKWNIENQTFYESFFKHIMRPHENIGVDFWWLDWQQWLLAPEMENLGNTFWLNYVFYNDMKVNRPDRRPMIFHRWGGLGNHRYPIGFSGDTWSTFPTLAFQIYFNSTASNVAYGYWSHDLGGHQGGTSDPELFLRWIQFGVFSPITRTHGTKAEHIERRIWKYPNFEEMRDALKFRYAMIPYIYTYSREAYDTGLSLCRPLYYDSPEANEAYKQETTYMFGDEILVSPIATASKNQIGTSTKNIWFPEGEWVEAETGTVLEGNQDYLRSFAQNEIPFFYSSGAIIPMYPDINHLKERPDTLVVQFIPGESGTFNYYEDDGDNENYKDGNFTTTKIEQKTNDQQGEYTIYGRQGSFENMPAERSYELRLLSKLPAQKVVVDGNVYPYSSSPQKGHWTYDGKQMAIVINLPPKDCNTNIKVHVDYDDKQAESESLIAGKMGQMARMAQCHDSINEIIEDQMPDLFTELAITSTRITENPQNTIAILEDFEENLESSFDLLMDVENAPVKEIKEWKEFIMGIKDADSQSDYGGSEKNEAIGSNPDGSNLWITGSAIPDTTVILKEDPTQIAGYFRYHGELQTGEFKIMNTPTIQSNTKFYVPVIEDANAAGNYSMQTTTDENMPGWNVTIPDKYYKIKINTLANTLNGEIFKAREDLFMVGGATEAGWDSGNSIRLKKDLNNPNLFIFSGNLKIADTGGDRNMFKLLGQKDWDPVSFHPKTQNKSILESKYIYENLQGDHKWSIDSQKQGHYVIKVDLLEETIDAKYTDGFLYALYINGVDWENIDEIYPIDCSNPDDPLQIEIIPIEGKTVDIGSSIEFKPTERGINELEFSIISQDGATQKKYKLKVSKPLKFDNLVTQKWNNTLTVNNNPEENGGYKFVDFEWYEDDKMIGNKQSYSAGNSSTDHLNENAAYSVKLTDENGNKYHTCPTQVTLEELSQNMIYPNIVQVGETIHVETFFNNSQATEKNKLDVRNMNGSIVYSQKFTGSKTSFKIGTPGFYFVQLYSGSNVRVAKLIVKK
ncbi:MAG: TIM-barrel domain-containing protein [Bacteroidota bacterium]